MLAKTKFEKMKINYYFSKVNPLIAFSFSLMFVSFVSIYSINFDLAKSYLAKEAINETEKVLAIVSGRNITLNEFKEIFDPEIENLTFNNNFSFKTDDGKKKYFELRKQIFNDLVLKKVLLIDAENKKIDFTSEEVDAEIQRIKATNFQNNEESFQKAMKKNNSTIEKLKKIVRERTIIKKVLDKMMDDNIKLTDNEILDFYNSNKKNLFTSPEQVEASHILVKEKSDAEMLISELAIGANFEALAKKYSIDFGSKDNGGKLGFFTKSMMVKEFEDATWKLKDGKHTLSPIKTQFGWHVIKRTNSKVSKIIPFEEVKGEISEKLINTKKHDFFEKWKEKTLKDTDVKFNKGYQNFVSRNDEYLEILNKYSK